LINGNLTLGTKNFLLDTRQQWSCIQLTNINAPSGTGTYTIQNLVINLS
jgi:hypothetical protein